MSEIETLYGGPFYRAELLTSAHGGLIVTRKRKRGGVILKPDHSQYADYVETFRTALDDSERSALCRALLDA